MRKKYLAPTYKKALKKKQEGSGQLSLFGDAVQQEIFSMEQNIKRAEEKIPMLEQKVASLKKEKKRP